MKTVTVQNSIHKLVVHNLSVINNRECENCEIYLNITSSKLNCNDFGFKKRINIFAYSRVSNIDVKSVVQFKF